MIVLNPSGPKTKDHTGTGIITNDGRHAGHAAKSPEALLSDRGLPLFNILTELVTTTENTMADLDRVLGPWLQSST